MRGLQPEREDRVHFGALLARVQVNVLSANGKRINNESANANHKQQRREKYAVGKALDTVHPAYAARSECPIRQNA